MVGADTSCNVCPDGGKGDDDVMETVARIGGKLASQEGSEAVVVVESLRELQCVRMTFEALEATKIGRAVNTLRKNAPSEQARRLAAALYGGWKVLADERFTSSRAQQQPPPTPPPKADKGTKNSSTTSLSPSPPVDVKMAPTSVVVEAALEKKVHLHEVFDSVTIVKKPNSLRVRVINTYG